MSFESRYGTCASWCVSERITFPSALSELLMKQASLRDSPPVPASVCRSLPARSMRWNCDFRVTVMSDWTSFASDLRITATSQVR